MGKTTRSAAAQGQAKLWHTLGYWRIWLAAVHGRQWPVRSTTSQHSQAQSQHTTTPRGKHTQIHADDFLKNKSHQFISH
jgi:hypothetical protein